MKLRSLLLAASLALAVAPQPACTSSAEEDVDLSEDELTTRLSVRSIGSERTFRALSTEGGAFGQAGRTVKFLIDARDPAAPRIHFINANYQVGGRTPDYAKYHYYFARKELGVVESNQAFNDATYFTDDKRYFAGTLQTYSLGEPEALHYAVQFYPDDVIHDEVITRAIGVVAKALRIRDAKKLFVATGPQQTFERVVPDLAALGFGAMSIDDVLGSVKYLPLNPGEAWGYLRIFPRDLGELRPTDIVVFDELPLDLSVVAGTITKVFQDVTSHVNLKAKERGTPNMVLRDAGPAQADLAPFADKPVHLRVGKTGFVIEATTPELVEAKLRERTDKPWVALPLVPESRVVWYDEMCPTLTEACTQQGNRLGGKSANLGFLANRSVLGRVSQPGSESAKLGYELVPQGFGLPVQFYRDFLALPDNAALKAKIDAFVVREKSGELSPNERRALAAEIREGFYVAKVPPAQLALVQEQIGRLRQLVPNLEKMKFRSSANAEDIPNFDGAGLHDSFSVKLSSTDNAQMSCRIEVEQDGPATKLEIKPKTPQCGIKGVYASLWNARAIEERSFARLDHATAGMGIAVVPAYDTDGEVTANGVVITRAINSDVLAYTLSLQKDNNLVTNPDPGTISQMTLATFGGFGRPTRFTVVRRATPVAGAPPLAASVLPDPVMDQLTELSKKVETAYCKVKRGYYDGDCRQVFLDDRKERALDMELKVTEGGRFVIKQVREFHGR